MAVTRLVWTTGNPARASLSTDDPPTLTAVAPGTGIVYLVGMLILGTDGYMNLIALGLDGSVLWQQAIPFPAGGYDGLNPPLIPLYATADGGAIVRSGTPIGSSQPGTLYTLDANGNITSQAPDTGAVYSWTNEWYDPPQVGGTVSATNTPPMNLAAAWAAIRKGNHSGTATAIQQQWFPPLKSCYNPSNNTMWAYDSLLVALDALQSTVSGSCPDCVKWVFNKLGPAGDQQLFSRFIRRMPQFLDGTKSTLPVQYLSGDAGSLDAIKYYYAIFKNGGSYTLPNGQSATTVSEIFTKQPAIMAVSVYIPAIAHRGSGDQGLLIFFDPPNVCTDYAINSPCQVYNQSTLFHEGLHNFYGYNDSTIQASFGIPVISCTADITDYISFTVYATAVNSCGQ